MGLGSLHEVDHETQIDEAVLHEERYFLYFDLIFVLLLTNLNGVTLRFGTPFYVSVIY